MCFSRLSDPRQKTSRRPGAQDATVGRPPVTAWCSGGMVMVGLVTQSVDSVKDRLTMLPDASKVNTSISPFAFETAAGALPIGPRSWSHDQPVLGNHRCCNRPDVLRQKA